MINASTELNRFLDRHADLFNDAILKLIRAHLGQANYDKALWDLANLIQKTMILADLHGRKRMLMQADYVERHQTGRFTSSSMTPIVPDVPFVEAIEDLVSREPRLERSSKELSRLYNTEHVFGLAYSSDVVVTKKIQDVIAASMKEGTSLTEAEPIISQMGDWTRSYSDVVYRTNAATSYNKGRFQQAKDENVAKIIPAMEFFALIGDPATRPNHAAAHGLIAATDNPIWKRFRPPLGYQCRCSAEFVSIFDLEDRGLIKDGKVTTYFPPNFQNAYPDPGFKVGAVDMGYGG